MNHMKFIKLLCLAVLLSGFSEMSDRNSAIHTRQDQESYSFYVLQAGWHTGIVLRTRDVSADDWPEIVRFSQYTWIDIGWGDERFYQNPGNPVRLAVRAVMVPTASVIHLVAFSISPESVYAGENRIKEITAGEAQFRALCVSLSNSFIRDSSANIIPGARHNFFLAKGKYHLMNTCNTWVVERLQEAGFDVRPAGIVTRHQLFRELEGLPGGDWATSFNR